MSESIVIDNKTAPAGDDQGFTKRLSRATRKRLRTREGNKQKKNKQQKKKKERKPKPTVGQETYSSVPDEKSPEIGRVVDQQQQFVQSLYQHCSQYLQSDFDVFDEAVRSLGLRAIDVNNDQQRQILFDAIRRIEEKRILGSGDDEDTKHTEIKDTPGSVAMDISADISMNLSQSPIDMVDTSEMLQSPIDPTPVSELEDTNGNFELKMDLSESLPPVDVQTSQPATTTPPDATHSVEVTKMNGDATTAESDGSRRKSKRKRRRKKKQGSEMSPSNEPIAEIVETTEQPANNVDVEQAVEDDDEDEEIPVMNGGHVEEDEPEYEVVEQPLPSPQEILDHQVDAFDCTQPESRMILQRWLSSLQTDYNKSFSQMFFSAKAVEKVASSLLRNPNKSLCDNEIIQLFHECLLGPRDYHMRLFQETKRLAAKLTKHKGIRESILQRLEDIIAVQKTPPQSSAPEIEKQVFDAPSKGWQQNASCPSYDMWQSVDSQAASLQEAHSLLREEKLQTQLMQPNKNPQFLHSLKIVNELFQDGTTELTQREVGIQRKLDQFKQERSKIAEARRTKIQPLQTQLSNTQAQYHNALDEKQKLEHQLAQINRMIADLERDQRELERKIREENDFGMTEQRLDREIEERKFELAVIQSESQCFTDLRALARDIYQRLDVWSNQKISEQQEMQDGLAQRYLNQLVTFIESYTKILQFFTHRVSFAHELTNKRQSEQKEASRLYGREKARAYEDEISRYKTAEKADKATADTIRMNMYAYIDGAQGVVRDSRFREFIYHLEERVGRTLDLTKYLRKSERQMLRSSGIEKSRRDAGAQTSGPRDYPSRGPIASNSVSMTTHDLSIPRSRSGGVPVVRRNNSYPTQAQPNSATNPTSVAQPQPTTRPLTHSTTVRSRPSVIFPQFPPGPFQPVMGMQLPHHQTQGLMAQSVSAGVPTMAARVPNPTISVQGHLDLPDQGLQQRPQRTRNNAPIVGRRRFV